MLRSRLVSAIDEPANLEQTAQDRRGNQPGDSHAESVHGGREDGDKNGGDEEDGKVDDEPNSPSRSFHGQNPWQKGRTNTHASFWTELGTSQRQIGIMKSGYAIDKLGVD